MGSASRTSLALGPGVDTRGACRGGAGLGAGTRGRVRGGSRERVVLGASAGLAYAVFLMLLRFSNRELAAPVGPLLDATIGATVASLMLGILDGELSLVPHWPAHGWLIALALLCQVWGWWLISGSLPRLPALDTSLLLLLQPMLTVLWGFLLFAEALSRVQWAGVALVLGGVGALSMLGTVKRSDG